ncbi:hypothetical protein [Synoicihabitans lomoniglobus]|uniref:Uncharacterized protein n=1 Tax=Synoicihabitans lomoniglobus TaxID=2909285 RepID=A0AAF0CH92_9BACT|nr:hypothetical protein [Opitutaceae bacterium LMO-M01]WED64022.1 hypothetical protein PXH66_16920 [Opitutaceae bacterium LMO-M01]
MRKLVPYKTTRNALAALDNGGRFYNLLTKSADGEIAPAELAKVAGVYSDQQQMFLFLEMALAALPEDGATTVVSALSPELKKARRRHRPAMLSPAAAVTTGKPGKSLIVTGVPRYVQSNTDFVGFIMIPISTGKVTTFSMVPIMDAYDVYEVRDDASDANFLVAHARTKTKLPAHRTTFGGILKKLEKSKAKTSAHHGYLDALFYTPQSD